MGNVVPIGTNDKFQLLSFYLCIICRYVKYFSEFLGYILQKAAFMLIGLNSWGDLCAFRG